RWGLTAQDTRFAAATVPHLKYPRPIDRGGLKATGSATGSPSPLAVTAQRLCHLCTTPSSGSRRHCSATPPPLRSSTATRRGGHRGHEQGIFPNKSCYSRSIY